MLVKVRGFVGRHHLVSGPTGRDGLVVIRLVGGAHGGEERTVPTRQSVKRGGGSLMRVVGP